MRHARPHVPGIYEARRSRCSAPILYRPRDTRTCKVFASAYAGENAGFSGAGAYHGGLGQMIEIEAACGYSFHFSVMLDRIENPARRMRQRAGGRARLDGAGRRHDAARQLLCLPPVYAG